MTITANAKVANPDSVEVTVEITMPSVEWRRLQKALEGGDYPQWPVAQAIRKALIHFRESHEGSVEYNSDDAQ